MNLLYSANVQLALFIISDDCIELLFEISNELNHGLPQSQIIQSRNTTVQEAINPCDNSHLNKDIFQKYDVLR